MFYRQHRKNLCEWLFKKSTIPYTQLFKRHKQPWGLTNEDLIRFNTDTLGFALGQFLIANNFLLFPKLERHDAYHVITGFGIEVENEIALQYYLLGNGKRSIYLFGVITIGMLLLPDYRRHFVKSYYQGKTVGPIYEIDIKNSLTKSLQSIQHQLFNYHNL